MPRAADGWTTGRVAELVGAACEGPSDRPIREVATLDHAGPDALAFCSGGRWLPLLGTTRAGVVLLDLGDAPAGVIVLRHPEPRLAFARAATAMCPVVRPPPGVHPTAVVHASAFVAAGATIEAFAVVEARARVGDGAWLQAHTYVGADAVVGPGSRLMPHAVLLERCVLGARVRLQPGAVVGGDGFGYAASDQGLLPVPQLGVVVVEDDVDIGVNTCVDRAALDETRVGAGSRLDNLVQIAHGVKVGTECLLAAFAAVSGGAELGARVVMAGRTAVTEHVKVGDGAVLYGMSATSRDLAPGARVGGAPARPYTQWAREQVAMRDLPGLVRLVERLRKKVEALERSAQGQ